MTDRLHGSSFASVLRMELRRITSLPPYVCRVAVSPAVGFGPGGERYVRFALVENEHGVRQTVAGLREAVPGLRETVTADR